MSKNFSAMPWLLKLLTVASIGPAMFCAFTVFSDQTINVFGMQIGTHEWWISGAGLATLATSFFSVISALLMLMRSHLGRPTYILNWIVGIIYIPLAAHLVGADIHKATNTVIYNLVSTIFICSYLYISKSVSNYFASGDKIN